MLALARREDVLAGVVGAVVLAGSLALGLTSLEALGATALCVPLAWRTRRPWGVLALVFGGAVTYLAVADPSPLYVPPVAVAMYTVAAHGTRRKTVALAGGLVPAAFAIALLFSPDSGSTMKQTFEIVSQLGFVLAVGEAVRSQRAFIAAMRERALVAEREHELEARRRVDEERVRIARDVHDVVAHSIATISTQASVGVHVGREDPQRAVEVLQAIKEVSTRALHDLRYALGVLRDDAATAPTGPTPSMQDLHALVGTARTAGLPVVLRMEGSPTALPAALQVAIYRIVQEGLTNVMRHASGAQATVRIAVAAQRVEVDVSDDGAGAPTASGDAGAGAGLIGMRERASALGGALEAGHGPGGGFRVRAVLPLDERPA